MTTNQWDDDDYNDDDSQGQKPKGNTLRDKLEAALAEVRELKGKLATAEATARTATVSNLVKEKNLDPKIAKLMPKDIEPTTEAIDKWLEEYGDLFKVNTTQNDTGAETQTSATEDAEDEGDGYAAAMRSIQGTQAAGTAPVKAQDVLTKLTNPNLTKEDLMSMIMAAGGGAGSG